MNCTDIENQIIDFIDGTLTSAEMEAIKLHLSSCDNCRQLHFGTKALLKSLNEIPLEQPSANLRTSFEELLDKEKQLQAKSIVLNPHKNSWKAVLQIAATLALLVSGYLLGSLNTNQGIKQEMLAIQNESSQMKQNLMLAMIDDRSPSKRIKAVGLSEEITKPNTKILMALIERMQYDSNSNVRLSAAEALSKFTESELVLNALMTVLTTEENPSVQIEIIQILAKVQERRAIAPMRELLERPETPIYVRDQVNIGIAQLI